VSEVRNDEERHSYLLEVDGHIAFAAYRREGNDVVFYHTVVPEALAGQGVGSRLVEGALADVRARGLKVVPLCAFVRHYIETHAETQDLLA
jgi:predicted GNAT family acetyltransferase